MQRKQQVGECWVCVIFMACLCVGASNLTTTSDDHKFLSSLCCVRQAIPRGVPGGARYGPFWLRVVFGAAPKFFFGVVFTIFIGFC
jgi:hypothetical protein